MQIGEIASATGISRDTLRFYEKRGLLNARRSANGYRDYPPEAVDWLRYIRTAQLGFSRSRQGPMTNVFANCAKLLLSLEPRGGLVK